MIVAVKAEHDAQGYWTHPALVIGCYQTTAHLIQQATRAKIKDDLGMAGQDQHDDIKPLCYAKELEKLGSYGAFMIMNSHEERAIQCADMAEIRAEIDRIDRDVISLLGERYAFVKAASKFKTSRDQVKAQSRFNSMLQERRIWAEEQGLSSDLIEKIYRDLVTWFISEEMRRWEEEQPDLT